MLGSCGSQLAAVSVTKDFLTSVLLGFYWKQKSREFACAAASELPWMCFLTVSLGHSFPSSHFSASVRNVPNASRNKNYFSLVWDIWKRKCPAKNTKSLPVGFPCTLCHLGLALTSLKLHTACGIGLCFMESDLFHLTQPKCLSLLLGCILFCCASVYISHCLFGIVSSVVNGWLSPFFHHPKFHVSPCLPDHLSTFIFVAAVLLLKL